MSSYITQLEIIKHEDREILQTLVNTFIVNKCIKKVDFYINSTLIESVPEHMAYVYYTIPKAPVLTITSVEEETGLITIKVESPIYIPITGTGICWNTTGNPTVNDNLIVLNNEYTIQEKTIYEVILDTYTDAILDSYGNVVLDSYSFNFESGVTYYFRPYIYTCIGLTYGEIFTKTIL